MCDRNSKGDKKIRVRVRQCGWYVLVWTLPIYQRCAVRALSRAPLRPVSVRAFRARSALQSPRSAVPSPGAPGVNPQRPLPPRRARRFRCGRSARRGVAIAAVGRRGGAGRAARCASGAVVGGAVGPAGRGGTRTTLSRAPRGAAAVRRRRPGRSVLFCGGVTGGPAGVPSSAAGPALR